MADNINNQLPEQQILPGVPLNVQQIRAEARKRLKEFKLGLWLQEERKKIVQQPAMLQARGELFREVFTTNETEKLREKLGGKSAELSAKEYIQIRNAFQSQLKNDLSRFLVLSNSDKINIDTAAQNMLDECVLEELLTRDTLNKYRYGLDNKEHVEQIKELTKKTDAMGKEYMVIPKGMFISDLNSVQYSDIKVFIVTEGGEQNKRMVGVVRKDSLQGELQRLEESKMGNPKIEDSGILLKILEPLSPEDANKFVKDHDLAYYPVVNENNEYDGVISRQELEAIVHIRTKKSATTLQAQIDIDQILKSSRGPSILNMNQLQQKENNLN